LNEHGSIPRLDALSTIDAVAARWLSSPVSMEEEN